MLKLYKTYVLPLLEYASPVWSPQYIGLINKLERVQKFFTKRIYGFENIPYAERLILLDMKSLEYRRLIIDLKLTFEIICGHVNLDRSAFFEISANNRTRGNRFKLVIPFARSGTRSRFFAARVVPVFNSLPDSILRDSNVNRFSRELINLNLNRFLKGSYIF